MPFAFSDVVSLGALGVSIWSMKRTNDYNRRADRLNALLIERESLESESQKRADVSANFVKVGTNSYRLKVFNKGIGTATNVRLETLDDKAAALLMSDDLASKFPLPVLEQHQSIEVHARVHMQSPNRAQIRLLWDDASGKDRQKEIFPTL